MGPMAAFNMDVNLATTVLWRKVWSLAPGCRQTRYWFPDGPRPDFAFDILRLPRVLCSQICQFITGHCFLNKHTALIENKYWGRIGVALAKQNIDPDNAVDASCPKCRICG